MDLKEKVVFITGAAMGLGKAYSIAFLERGAKVFMTDVDAQAGVETLGECSERFGKDMVRFEALDVTDHAKFAETFHNAVEAFGSIDLMVNNAGIMNESMWDLMIQIDLVAVVVGTNLASEHMRKDKGGKGGRIINICSAAGLTDAFIVPVYCACKHGVRTFTSCLANQPNIKDQGIQYALLCPEAVATRMILEADDTKVNFFPLIKDTITEDKCMPLSRIVGAMMQLIEMDDMNGAILFVSKDTIQQREMKAVDVEKTSSNDGVRTGGADVDSGEADVNTAENDVKSVSVNLESVNVVVKSENVNLKCVNVNVKSMGSTEKAVSVNVALKPEEIDATQKHGQVKLENTNVKLADTDA